MKMWGLESGLLLHTESRAWPLWRMRVSTAQGVGWALGKLHQPFPKQRKAVSYSWGGCRVGGGCLHSCSYFLTPASLGCAGARNPREGETEGAPGARVSNGGPQRSAPWLAGREECQGPSHPRAL